MMEDEKMNNISPKKYYQKAFEELLQEIKENTKQAQKIIKLKKKQKLRKNFFCWPIIYN